MRAPMATKELPPPAPPFEACDHQDIIEDEDSRNQSRGLILVVLAGIAFWIVMGLSFWAVIPALW